MNKLEINPGAIQSLKLKTNDEIKSDINYYYNIIKTLRKNGLNEPQTKSFIKIHKSLITIYSRELERRNKNLN